MSLEHAFFYKSVNGDRVYDDTSFEHWLKKFFTSGVFLNDLQVTANEDMTVTVGAGYTNIDGKVKIFESATPLIIETAGASYPRIDSIVLERNDTERDILLKVIKGGYSSEPVAHTPVRQDGVYQLVIAQILVNAGAVKVTQADITDTRSNIELCGIVAGAVDQIDFSQIQAQFDSYFAQYKTQIATDYTEYNADMETYLDQMAEDFATWFEGIRNQLDEDAAGHLQNQIDDINARLEYAGGSIVEVTVNDNEGAYNAEGLEVNLVIDGKTYVETINDNIAKFTGVLEVGTAVITCDDESQKINAKTSIEIPYYGAYETSVKLVDSYKGWIEAGGLNPSSYENLDALLEDEKAVRTLMTKKDAVDVLAQISGDDLATIINHRYAAKWINYRDYAYSTLSSNADIKALMDASGMYGCYQTAEIVSLVPAMSDYSKDGYTVIYSDEINASPNNWYAWKVFNNNTAKDSSTSTQSWAASNPVDSYIGMHFPTKTNVKSFTIENYNFTDSDVQAIKEFILQGSDNGEVWNDIQSYTNTVKTKGGISTYNVDKYCSYYQYRILIKSVYQTYGIIRELQLYGEKWQPKGLVPVMTSNTAPYGEASASSEATKYEAYKAFDGEDSHGWLNQGTTPVSNIWLKYKFVNPTNVKRFTLKWWSTNKTIEYVIQGSNDNSQWHDLTERITDIGNREYQSMDNDNFYIYYRVYIYNQTATSSTANGGQIATLQFYGRQIEALIPPMTSNTTPIGEASASAEHTSTSGVYSAWKALDGDSTTFWHNKSGETTGNIMYRFENPVCAKMFKLTNRTYTSDSTAPKNIKLFASNDGDKWVEVSGELVNTNGSGVTSYFNIDNNNVYLYYKLEIYSTYASTVNIAELQFYGTPDYESRTYIYEHGVEVMDIEVGGCDASYGTETIEADRFKVTSTASTIPSTAGIIYPQVYCENLIDVTNYKICRVKTDTLLTVGTSSRYGNLCCVDGVPASRITNEAVSYVAIRNITDYLDVSSINDNHYFIISANASSTVITIAEWWFE